MGEVARAFNALPQPIRVVDGISPVDLVLMVAFGVVGYVFRKASIPLAPAILGVVLGPLMEKNLRRSLPLSGGDWGVLFSSSLAISFWVLAVGFLVGPPLLAKWTWRRAR